MFRIVLAAIVLLSIGCSKQELKVQAGRKAGWTDSVYAVSIADCKDALNESLNDVSKSDAICECYTSAISVAYTVEELAGKDYATQKATQSTLVACAEKRGESISYNARLLFLRDPMEEKAKTPDAVKDTLNRVKRKTHAPAPETTKSDGKEAPKEARPVAPGPGGAPLRNAPPTRETRTGAKVKYVAYNRDANDSQSESFLDSEVEYSEAKCVLDQKNTLKIELKNGDSSHVFSIKNFISTKKHWTMSGEKTEPEAEGDNFLLDYVWKKGTAEEITFKPEAKSESTITNVNVSKKVLTGKFDFKSLLGNKAHASAQPGEQSVMNMSGSFACDYTVLDRPQVKLQGPALKNAPLPPPAPPAEEMPE